MQTYLKTGAQLDHATSFAVMRKLGISACVQHACHTIFSHLNMF
ncbi:MAG: hypothetical protein ABL925_19625 [Methylococcales bacterium]